MSEAFLSFDEYLEFYCAPQIGCIACSTSGTAPSTTPLTLKKLMSSNVSPLSLRTGVDVIILLAVLPLFTGRVGKSNKAHL